MLGQEDGKESGASIPQDFHGQSIVSDEISSVGAESHSRMELKTTEKATQTKLKGIHTRVQRLNGFQRIQIRFTVLSDHLYSFVPPWNLKMPANVSHHR